MRPQLDAIELRVLGVLIEKSLTQPGGYPLTLNALVLGANQKQNRDPVLELTEADVARALGRLQRKDLAEQAPPDAGARSNRFAHRVVETLQWDRRDQAVMAELMLRGRQTAGELRTHASRMTPFGALESIQSTLCELAGRESPLVEELPREPGRSANRWRHLLEAPVAQGAADATPTCPEASGGVAENGSLIGDESQTGPLRDPERSESDNAAVLAGRVATLEARVAALADEVAALRRDLSGR